MSKLTTTQFSRISQYIKMFEGDRETLQFAWANTWEEDDMEDYWDLSDNDIKKYIAHLRDIVGCKKYTIFIEKELLNECEGIYQQWRLINGKIVSK
jgi:hypothetical protein